MKPKLAIFDFDGTLTTKDSLFEFAKFVLGKRRACLAIVRTLPYIFLWKVGIKSNSEAKQKLVGNLFRGVTKADFEAFGSNFASVIDKISNSETLGHLRSHITNGYRVFIVSASMPAWIRPWAVAQGVKSGNVIGTEPEVSPDGVLTGRFATPNCYGEEKVNRFKQAVPDYSDYEIYSYGDSSGDSFIMNLADHKIWVK